MPGNPLNITLPTVGSTAGPTYATQINDAIQTLIDDIEAKIVPAEMDINEDLSFQSGGTSYGITDLDRLTFDEQGSVLTVGNYANTIFVYGDELYFQDGDGANVAITSGGSLAGTPGSITSQGSPSYGSPYEVIWDGSNGNYEFKNGASTYADLMFRYAEFRNGNFTTTMRTTASANYSIIWPSAAPAANDLAIFDSGGNITFSATIPGAKTFSAALTASNGITVTTGGATVAAGGLTVSAGGADVTGNSTVTGDLTVTGNVAAATHDAITLNSGEDLTLQGAGEIKHGERILYIPASAGFGITTAGATQHGWDDYVNDFQGFWESDTIGDILVIPISLLEGDRITDIQFYYAGATTGTKRFSLISHASTTSNRVVEASATATSNIWTNFVLNSSSATSGTGMPYTMTGAEFVFAQYRAAAGGDKVTGVRIAYDRP